MANRREWKGPQGLGGLMSSIHFAPTSRWNPKAFPKSQTMRGIDKSRRTILLEAVMTDTFGNTITLGADPEFVVLYDDSMYAASRLFDTHELGCDGHNSTAEIRPAPSTDPLIVQRNICNILEQANARLARKWPSDRWQVRAGSGIPGDPCGGHIHFGINATSSVKKHSRTKVTESIALVLDDYLSVPLMMIEDMAPMQTRRGRGWGYGDLYRFNTNSVREQSHGFEYRTPPSWLVAQRYSKAVLCLAVVLADAVVCGTKFPQLSYDQSSFAAAAKPKFAPLLPGIFRKWRTLRLWPNYAQHISVIPQLISQQKTWSETWDFSRRWRVMRTLAIKKKTIPAVTPPATEPPPKHFIPSVDAMTSAICAECETLLVREPFYAMPGFQVYIYGLSPSRGDSIYIFGFKPNQDFVTNRSCIPIRSGRYGSGGMYPVTIGLPRQLRLNPRESARYVLELLREATLV